MFHLFHSQQEKELMQYDDYLGKSYNRLSFLQSACVLVAFVVALVLMATAYCDVAGL